MCPADTNVWQCWSVVRYAARCAAAAALRDLFCAYALATTQVSANPIAPALSLPSAYYAWTLTQIEDRHLSDVVPSRSLQWRRKSWKRTCSAGSMQARKLKRSCRHACYLCGALNTQSRQIKSACSRMPWRWLDCPPALHAGLMAAFESSALRGQLAFVASRSLNQPSLNPPRSDVCMELVDRTRYQTGTLQ